MDAPVPWRHKVGVFVMSALQYNCHRSSNGETIGPYMPPWFFSRGISPGAGIFSESRALCGRNLLWRSRTYQLQITQRPENSQDWGPYEMLSSDITLREKPFGPMQSSFSSITSTAVDKRKCCGCHSSCTPCQSLTQD